MSNIRKSMADVAIGEGKLAGKGVYAARDFQKGELVKSYNLKLLTQAEFDKLPRGEHMFVHSFGGKMYLFPEPSRYTNHSATPNTYADFQRMCDYAARSIKKGEMITTNATTEVHFELESFVKAHESASIANFTWLKGGYRNAEVRYELQGSTKKLVLKRIDGNWRIVDETS